MSYPVPSRRLLDACCFLVVCILLTLGLWPFHAPTNTVAWLPGSNGLRLQDPATSFTRSLFPARDAFGSQTIEIWLQPLSNGTSATFLSFAPNGFRLRQSLTDLELRTETAHTYVADVFRKTRPLFLALASSPAGTTIYVNGALARRSPFHLPPAAGQLILGDSPVQPDSWSGRVLGLAIYDRELTAADLPFPRPPQPAEALYLFDEHSGRVAHDRGSLGADLYIPERYTVIDKLFLEPFWHEFEFSRSYWSSALKNIVGFLPLGLCFYPCLVSHGVRRPVLFTVLCGTAVSVAIEVAQGWLPTRDSGTTDIFTNTLGAFLGVLLFRAAGRYVPVRQHVTMLLSLRGTHA